MNIKFWSEVQTKKMKMLWLKYEPIKLNDKRNRRNDQPVDQNIR